MTTETKTYCTLHGAGECPAGYCEFAYALDGRPTIVEIRWDDDPSSAVFVQPENPADPTPEVDALAAIPDIDVYVRATLAVEGAVEILSR